MIESREDYKLKDTVTLGDLINDKANEEQLLFIPVLKENGGLPVIRGYYAMTGGVPKGEIGLNEAMLSYLTQGKIEKLYFTMEDQTPVSIRRITAKRRAIPVWCRSVWKLLWKRNCGRRREHRRNCGVGSDRNFLFS